MEPIHFTEADYLKAHRKARRDNREGYFPSKVHKKATDYDRKRDKNKLRKMDGEI